MNLKPIQQFEDAFKALGSSVISPMVVNWIVPMEGISDLESVSCLNAD